MAARFLHWLLQDLQENIVSQQQAEEPDKLFHSTTTYAVDQIQSIMEGFWDSFLIVS